MVVNQGTAISTTMVQVSAGSASTIWGVDASHNIYQYTGSGSTWTQIPGVLTQVSVGVDGTVWGVNPAHTIYRYNGNNSWTQINGNLAQVAVGSASLIWGVNPTTTIYQYNGNNSWTQMPGNLKQVSVSSNSLIFGGPPQTIWGVNSAGTISQYNGSGWTMMPGSDKNNGGFSNPGGAFAQVAVGSAQAIYALDPAGNTLQYTPSDTAQPWHWVEIITATALSVAEDGTIVLIDTTGTTRLI